MLFLLSSFKQKERVIQVFTFMKTSRLSSIPRIPTFLSEHPMTKRGFSTCRYTANRKTPAARRTTHPYIDSPSITQETYNTLLEGRKNIKTLHFFPRIYKLVSLFSQNKNVFRWIQDTPFKISVTLKLKFSLPLSGKGQWPGISELLRFLLLECLISFYFPQISMLGAAAFPSSGVIEKFNSH